MKVIKNIIIYSLTVLIIEIIELSNFPDILKISKPIPIHNRGELVPKNIRPISVVPSVYKIIESILKNQISDHFETIKLFFTYQCGFRPNKSTNRAITNLTAVERSQDSLELTKTILHRTIFLSATRKQSIFFSQRGLEGRENNEYA